MKMQKLEVSALKSIAKTHAITYEQLKSSGSLGVATRMSREFPVSQKTMYNLIADIAGHTRLLPHLRKLKVITSRDLGGVLGKKGLIVVEGLEEGGSKIGIKKFTLTPPNRVDGVLLTDPFVEPGGSAPMHNKGGRITWMIDKVTPQSSRLTIESDFIPNNKTFYVRGLVDHVWLDFFENVMKHVGEIKAKDKLVKLFVKE